MPRPFNPGIFLSVPWNEILWFTFCFSMLVVTTSLISFLVTPMCVYYLLLFVLVLSAVCWKTEKKFRRRRLPYHLVMRCRRRIGNRPGWFYRWLYRSSTESTKKDVPSLPQEMEATTVPRHMIESFCSSFDFLQLMRCQRQFLEVDHGKNVRRAIARMNLLCNASALQNREKGGSSSFKQTPLVYDTGASYGLTPFRADFIDYQPCTVMIKDIARTNQVKGIGTVMYKFLATNGDVLYLPSLAYHLDTADIRLFSPQTYHQLYGGSSKLDGDHVLMQLMKQPHLEIRHDVEIDIEKGGTNLPMIYNVACSDKEKREIGPHFKSAMALLSRRLGFLGRWEVGIEDHSYEFGTGVELMFPCVSSNENVNLTPGQRELLLWHWKLGFGMQRVQELMKGHSSKDSAGKTSWMPPVIHPKVPSAASCPLPKCQTCELSRAKKRNPKVVRQQAIKEREAVLSWEKYQPGDFVSMDHFVVNTPGRLLSGYGREALHNRYHGGTIFNDAATGLIWIENQVTLGAGDTILAKESFEQWLRNKAWVEIKHLHSDNGVFTAKEFREDCKEKGQTQSFSGVGAQHQNARAERAIQTIMWMARTFILHVAMRWSERGVDNIALWGFAVKHAAWLYNRMPNRYSGLTPMELLTNIKADHRDLLRAHVWGCPCYVLDPKLQDGKKVPKFNRRARLGQFVGFSEQHSSLVALVRNLETGFVSPQFHVVFDDKFETVFSAGCDQATEDAIFEQLFEDSRDLYVEPECDDDGELVYQPPPLEEVWLSEPERRERQERLRQQRVRHEDLHRELARETASPEPDPSRGSPTPIGIVDDDESIPGAMRSPRRRPQEGHSPREGDSQADPSVIGAPEGENDPEGAIVEEDFPTPQPEPDPDLDPDGSDIEMEDDHEVQNEHFGSGSDNYSDEVVAEPTQQPTRRSAQDRRPKQHHGGNDDWDLLARERKGRQLQRNKRGSISRTRANAMRLLNFDNVDASTWLSKAERKRFALTLGAKAAPPTAARLSRKKMKYSQRMRHRREMGDRVLQSMSDEVPTIEALMASPLSKFIHLAANECGYNGTRLELICNWVHPFFLKAKSAASREDNPTWKEAMTGAFADEYWEACKVEIATLEGMDAWEVVERTAEMNVLPSTWAFKCKRYPDGLIKKFKARFCARGDRQIEGVDFFETYAPVVQWTTVRLMLILEVLLELKSKQGDVTAAFLHAKLEDNERVYVEMPRGFRKEGKVLSLKSTLYGLRQSPRAFWKYMVEKMEAVGLKQSEIDPCLFVGDRVIAISYVDDILFWSKSDEDIHDVAMQLREQGVDLEQEEDAAGFLGVRMEKNENGRLEMKQCGLIERVLEALGLDAGNEHGKATPAEIKPLVRDSEGEAASGSFNYASVVGMLLYLSGHSRPDIAYAVNCCARYMFAPKAIHEKALKRIGRYLKATRDKGLILNPSKETLKIDCFPDADFAGMYGHERNDDPTCVKSRTGYVITVADCPVLWQSKLQSETALSTMEAEIIALAHSCRELFPVMDLVKSMSSAVGLESPETSMHVSIHEDNAGALVLAKTLPPQFTPRSKWYAIKTIWFREEIQKRGVRLLSIPTKLQLGDICTKSLPKVTFEFLRERLMGW